VACCCCCGFHKGKIGGGIGRIKLAPLVEANIGKEPDGGGGGGGIFVVDEVKDNIEPFG
jgi:hypothetical protein